MGLSASYPVGKSSSPNNEYRGVPAAGPAKSGGGKNVGQYPAFGRHRSLVTPSPITYGGRSNLAPSSNTRRRTINVSNDPATDALLFSLQILGEAPIPGVKMVTIAISQTIVKSSHMKFNEQNLRDLRRRIVQLDEIVKQVHLTVKNTPVFLQHGHRMADVLRELAAELERQTARQPSWSLRFLSSSQDALALQQHMSALDRIISDLNLIISLDTNGIIREVREELRRSRSLSSSVTWDDYGDRSSRSSASATDTSRLTVPDVGTSGRRRSLTDISDSRSSASSSFLQTPTVPLQRTRSCDCPRPRPLHKSRSSFPKVDQDQANSPP